MKSVPAFGGVLDDAPLLEGVLGASSEGVVLCASDDTVLLANAAAKALVPELTPGYSVSAGSLTRLFDLMAAEGQSREAEHRGRRLKVRRQHVTGSHRVWYLRDTSAETLLTERRQADFLSEAGLRLTASLNVRRCAHTAVRLATDFLADAAILLLPARRRHVEWVRVWAGREPEEGRTPLAAMSEVPGVTDALFGSAVPSRWLDPLLVPAWLAPSGFGPVRALSVAALPGDGVPAGALLLLRREGSAPFDDQAETLVRLFAARVGAAICTAVRYQEQADVNAALSACLAPGQSYVSWADVAGTIRTCPEAGRTGGDFLDVQEREGELMVTLGDVCGRGARAALAASQLRHSLRMLRSVERRPVPLMNLINRGLPLAGMPSPYLSLALCSMRPLPGGGLRATLASAGHPAPLVLRCDGSVRALPVGGTPLGAFDDDELGLRAVDFELAPGELCLLHADGNAEALGGPGKGEPYGSARLAEALAGCDGMPATAVVERLDQLITEWTGGDELDDRGLLAVRARPPARKERDDHG
ncbi:PP2C family protein-serine/threonine phosphatase [Nonomuraea sp. NPDC050663]|uniref:PP2C family protein-serine/threonine phosphatase n=1 Tax=Nonomuraea sp. NPDC050663 TaxID=3364370 RepID=UPI0037B68E51